MKMNPLDRIKQNIETDGLLSLSEIVWLIREVEFLRENLANLKNGPEFQEEIWSCKIGGPVPEPFGRGGDWPMREAVKSAFKKLTGVDDEFCFTGWGAELSEFEREAYEWKNIQMVDERSK